MNFNTLPPPTDRDGRDQDIEKAFSRSTTRGPSWLAGVVCEAAQIGGQDHRVHLLDIAALDISRKDAPAGAMVHIGIQKGHGGTAQTVNLRRPGKGRGNGIKGGQLPIIEATRPPCRPADGMNLAIGEKQWLKL